MNTLKKNLAEKKAPKRDARPERVIPKMESLEDIRQYIELDRARPINKAWGKFYDFVNQCVSDPDFRHADSRALLDFLLMSRDLLTDGINEHWTLDDTLAPIEKAIQDHAARVRGAGRSKKAGQPEVEEEYRAWLAAGRFSKRGSKKIFDNEMADRHDIDVKTVSRWREGWQKE